MKRALLALCFCAFCAQVSAQTAPRRTLRVGLWSLWRDQEATISGLPGATLRLCASCAARPLETIVVRSGNHTLAWSGHGRTHAAPVLLVSGNYRIAAHGETLTLAYPLQVTAQSESLLLVATLPVERYVELVVAAESGQADGPESRKALAVVARSFALRPAHGHTAFDLCDSTHCQWAHWRATHQAHLATLATAGGILWRNGSRFDAYFHQNCGGHTAAANEVWPGRQSNHRAAGDSLSARPDPYCQRTGSSEWSATLSRAELAKALAAAGLVAPGWKTLTVAQHGSSGRAATLLIDSTKIAPEDLRLAVGRALGWNLIRSNWFEVAAQGAGFLFHGRGSGHGVGLCQVGAAEMAREGLDYRAILAQYFPGVSLAEQTTGAAWQTLGGHGFTLETSDAADATYLPELARSLSEAESRSGIAPRAAIAIRAYRSTPAFREATLAPGWVAAFTEGDAVAMQPLRTLSARRLLASVARHEFLHALVEEQETAQTPLWLREGVVEAWAANAPERTRPTLTVELVENKLAHAATEAESEVAHRAAGWYAQRLLDHFGRTQVLEWLRTGVPQSALSTFK